ncbi:MAG: anaerobic sulfatase maturase [Desulfovibrionaceae bacterium]
MKLTPPPSLHPASPAPSFPLLIKAPSRQCNLRCTHCFYHPVPPGKALSQRMSHDTLMQLTRTYLAQPIAQHTFIWQGGEPCLMGLDFFKTAWRFQKKYTQGSIIANCLQTNGTLITPPFADFLARKNFLVGLSIDGPQALHDTYRKYGSGKGSYAAVHKSLRLLQERKVALNSLTLITSTNIGYIKDIFYMLAENALFFQQYIPCVECSTEGKPLPFSLSGAAWGEALCILFDTWWNTGQRVTIRYFEDLLHTLLTGQAGSCQMGGDCRSYLVVEADGSVYPCDFFVSDAWKLGNIWDNTWEELLHSDLRHTFSLRKRCLPPACQTCHYLALCGGDCQKHRMASVKTAPPQSLLCEGYQIFFAHALPRLQEAARFLAGRLAQAPKPY